MLFATAALAIEGAQKGTYYGSVSWGPGPTPRASCPEVDVARVSKAVPSRSFMAPAELWSAGHARGSLITAADDTRIVSTDGDVQQIAVVDGEHVAKTGWLTGASDRPGDAILRFKNDAHPCARAQPRPIALG